MVVSQLVTNALSCPPDPDLAADAYCLGRLPGRERDLYERHYLGCPECSLLLQQTQAIIDALHLAQNPQQR
jgi:hypothetical protein